MSRGWSALAEGPVPFTAGPHLVGVSRTAHELAEELRGIDDDVVGALLDEATVASLRLDGSPIETPPTEETPRTVPVGSTSGAAGWLEVLARDAGRAEVVAVEYDGLRDCIGADDLADGILDAPLETLTEMHRRTTRGLVEPDQQGRWRTRPQAVHDASVGHLVLEPVAPEAIPERMDALDRWVRGDSRDLPPLIAAGVVHLELLATHPFESANGRLARTAARFVLRGRGFDPRGAVPVEAVLAEDPIGYLREVVATRRRRDLTVWLERWSETVAAGVRRALRRAGVQPPTPPARAVTFVAERRPGPFTLVDYRDAVGVGMDGAREDLVALLDAGRVRRVLGSRGLRFTVL